MLAPTFLVTYGDSYLPFDYAEPLRILDAHDDCDGVMSVFANHGAWDESNVSPTRAARGSSATRKSARELRVRRTSTTGPSRSGARSSKGFRPESPPGST